MQCALSVHLESFAFSSHPAIKNLSGTEKKRLDRGCIITQTEKLLSLLSAYNVKITFFIVSLIHEWYPDLVEKIAAAGHEIAWHTHTHAACHSQEALVRELEAARVFFAQYKPVFFCAPEFKFTDDSYNLLAEAGFQAATTGISHSAEIRHGKISEIPVSAIQNSNDDIIFSRGLSASFLIKAFPFGSSFFFPVVPVSVLINCCKKRSIDHLASNLFFHNWQIFFESLPAFFDRMSYFFRNPFYFPYLLPCRSTLEKLLREISFSPCKSVYLKI